MFINILFVFCFYIFFCFVYFCVFVLFCVLFLLLCCLFPTCAQVYRPLPPRRNPIAVNKYRIISYHIYSYIPLLCYYQFDKVKDDEIFRIQAWLTWVKYEMHTKFQRDNLKEIRSHWPRGLRLRSAAARLLKLWVRIPPGDMEVCLLRVLCFIRQRSLRRADHSPKGVLPNMVRRCM